MEVCIAKNEQISEFINKNKSWKIENKKLKNVYTFANFKQAFEFMTAVAKYAEKNNHHPEWSNTYKTVMVSLTTHKVSGISNLDFLMAEEMDRIKKTLS